MSAATPTKTRSRRLLRLWCTVALALAASAVLPAAGLSGPGDDGDNCLPTECQLPVAPSDFRVTNVTLSSISLEWMFEAGDLSELRRRQLPDGTWETLVSETPVAGPNAFTDSGLSARTGYCYRIAAVTDIGGSVREASAMTCAVTTDTPPAAPSGLTATGRGETLIEVVWLDNADNEDGARLEVRLPGDATWHVLQSYGVGGTAAMRYWHLDLRYSTEYCYRVKAWNFHGTVFSAPACARTWDFHDPVIFSISCPPPPYYFYICPPR